MRDICAMYLLYICATTIGCTANCMRVQQNTVNATYTSVARHEIHANAMVLAYHAVCYYGISPQPLPVKNIALYLQQHPHWRQLCIKRYRNISNTFWKDLDPNKAWYSEFIKNAYPHLQACNNYTIENALHRVYQFGRNNRHSCSF